MSVNDEMYTWLKERGYSGALNDMLKSYLSAQGHTGSLSDQLSAVGGWGRVITKFNPRSLLEGEQGLYVNFATGEGVGEETSDDIIVDGYRFLKRGSPVRTSDGMLFDRSDNQLLIERSRLADEFSSYPFTIAMQVGETREGSLDVGIINNAASYEVIRYTDEGNVYAVTRNSDYTSSKLVSNTSEAVILGHFNEDQTAVYLGNANGIQGPVFHTSQPVASDNGKEISIGGMSDSSPDYGSGIIRKVFMTTKLLSEEEVEQLIKYMGDR